MLARQGCNSASASSAAINREETDQTLRVSVRFNKEVVMIDFWVKFCSSPVVLMLTVLVLLGFGLPLSAIFARADQPDCRSR
jgi:hypothetical protein